MRALIQGEAPPDSSPPSLSLIVLRSGNVEATREFYSRMGLSFVEERHGSGPRHYAATIGPMVFEIYPNRDGVPPAPIRIGFRVSAFDETVEALRRKGARIIREAANSKWGRRAVVEDPDGNSVELAPVLAS